MVQVAVGRRIPQQRGSAAKAGARVLPVGSLLLAHREQDVSLYDRSLDGPVREHDVSAVPLVRSQVRHNVVNDVVELDGIAAAVEIGLAVTPAQSGVFRRDFVPADGPRALPRTGLTPNDAPGDVDAVVGYMVDQVVRDAVLAALPREDGRGSPVDLPDMVNMVVADRVALVDVLGAGTVARQQHPDTADVANAIADNGVAPAVQVQAHRRVPGVGERAILDAAAGRAPQPHERSGFVEQFPVVLQAPARASAPGQTVASREGQPPEHESLDRLVGRARAVDLPLHPYQLGQRGSTDVVARTTIRWPVVDQLRRGVQDPFPGLIQYLEDILDPGRGTVRHPVLAERIGSCPGCRDRKRPFVDRRDRQDVHDPVVHRDDDQLGVLQVSIATHRAGREPNGRMVLRSPRCLVRLREPLTTCPWQPAPAAEKREEAGRTTVG